MAPFKAVIITSLVGLASISALPVNAQDTGLPPNARPGACHIRYTAPALIETVTEQIIVQPEKRGIDAQTGQPVIISPAIYRTETVQKIIRDRHEAWVEIVCAKNLTVVFIQTLQRALTARQYYRGPITGTMDEPTKRAVRKVQKSRGINSPEVTQELAESYGLVTHRVFRK